MAKQLYWHHHYVKDGDMTPDKLGRWQVWGYIDVEPELVPDYAWSAHTKDGHVRMSIVWIEYTRYAMNHKVPAEMQFSVHMSFMSSPDNGLNNVFHAPTLEDAKRMAQEKLDHLVKCLS